MDVLPGRGRVRNVSAELRENARRLRAEMTPAERTLWSAIRDRQVEGLRFRRQHTVGTFILDFYCPALRLAVEVDGTIHQEVDVAEHDLLRQQAIEAFGVTVLRLQNETIERNFPAALDEICRTAARLSG